MPLIKHRQFVDDAFVSVADNEAMPLDGAIVSLNRFRAERQMLIARNLPLGVRLTSSESPDALRSDVHGLCVIALEFPLFRDGRPFSWARILRTRMGYTGEIRATGHFLYDQIAFLTRVGVDAFEVPKEFSIAQFNRALGEVSQVYQPSADRRITIPKLRHGVRRRDAGRSVCQRRGV